MCDVFVLCNVCLCQPAVAAAAAAADVQRRKCRGGGGEQHSALTAAAAAATAHGVADRTMKTSIITELKYITRRTVKYVCNIVV